MAELANCSRCDQLFVKNVCDICQNCSQEEEAAFKVVYHFLCEQKNREATMNQIIEATGVEKAFIIRFMKKGRLRASQFPNLGYACEQCGTKIVSNRICNRCAGQLKQTLNKHEAIQAIAADKRKSDNSKSNVYYSFK